MKKEKLKKRVAQKEWAHSGISEQSEAAILTNYMVTAAIAQVLREHPEIKAKVVPLMDEMYENSKRMYKNRNWKNIVNHKIDNDLPLGDVDSGFKF